MREARVVPDTEILAVRDLRVRLASTEVDLLRGLDLTVAEGMCVGVVGESGSGRTMLLRALLNLLPDGAAQSGSIQLQGRELMGLSERQWQKVRGREIAVVFRDPTTAMDKVMKIGAQVAEALKVHRRVSRRDVRDRVSALLEEVGLSPSVAGDYPHRLNVGDARRVMLAAALAGDPSVLLVDDNPGGLGSDEQTAFWLRVSTITRTRRLATVVSTQQPLRLEDVADQIAVLCGGLVMERGTFRQLAVSPRLPYTSDLLIPTTYEPTGPAPTMPPPIQMRERGRFGLVRSPAPPPRQNSPRPSVDEGLLLGCSYSRRCPRAVMACMEHEPQPEVDPAGHSWACWNPQPADTA